jgi:hypothetical protein
MKKISISQSAVKRTIEALDEVETAVLGAPTGRFRTDVKAGADDGTCKPWLCPRPLYGIPLPEEL